MWREYLGHDLRNNRGAAWTVMTAVFISALFLSLLCSIFYNVWNYEVMRITKEEGGFHARLEGRMRTEELDLVRGYANVESAAVNPEESRDGEWTVDIRLYNPSSAYEDLPRIARLAGLGEGNVVYHTSLLNLYFAVDARYPDSIEAWGVLVLFGGVLAAACFSLTLIIRHAFAVLMESKIRQLGILSSVGAAPGQIKRMLLKETAVLCLLPGALGIGAGILGSAGVLAWGNFIADQAIEGRMMAEFACHLLVPGTAAFLTGVTAFFSAWGPARRLSRISPLEAIRDSRKMGGVRGKRSFLPGSSFILRLIFGIPGELAASGLSARKKAVRTASLSLAFSLISFGLVQCFFAISSLSTQITYFDRFRNVWDVMVTVKETEIGRFYDEEAVRSLPGVREAVIYQKAETRRLVRPGELSREFQAAGGFTDASEAFVQKTEEGWLVNAPIYILDDESFLRCCRQNGARESLEGVIIFNQVRDDRDPNFRIYHSLPYLDETVPETVLKDDAGNGCVTLPVLCYSPSFPNLKEEYQTQDYYEMIHIFPVSLWETVKETVGGAEGDCFIQVKAEMPEREDSTDTSGRQQNQQEAFRLERMEDELAGLLGRRYQVETENRIQEKQESDRANQALAAILGSFCVLIGVIGISGVFFNALGFIRQRRREMARYLSVGMTPGEIRTMFLAEALVLAGRPVLAALPVLAAASWFFMKWTYLDPRLLLENAPVIPVGIFLLAVFAFTGLAFWLGWRTVSKMDLAEVLRDETFM